MVATRGGRMTVEEGELVLLGPAAEIPPLVLAAGPDELLRERLVRAFRRGAEREGSEFARLEGDELEAPALADALALLVLFGSDRRLWIREGSKLPAAVEETLLAWTGGSCAGVRVLVTTARERGELRWLGALSERGVSIDCVASPSGARRWAERLAEEQGLKLPAGALDALEGAAPDLLALSQELGKLAAHADPAGRVPAAALDSLQGARLSASLDRWADAVLAGDRARARAERPGLAAAGIGGTAALWALAERALNALEGGTAYGRPRRGPALAAGAAGSVLHAVYAADRDLKRGLMRDADLMDRLEEEVRESRGR